MDPTTQFMKATGVTDAKMAANLLAAAEGDVELATAMYQSTVSGRSSATSQPPAASKPKPKPTGGIMTMADLNKLNTGDDSDDDDRQSYYAGGAKGSGVQVKDPRKKPDVAKVVESVFDKARKGGARTDEEEEAESSKAFGGSGYRLGNTNTDNPARPAVQPRHQERLKKVVTFYRQGFVIDDGPLRPYNDPNNARFLQDVEEGYVPQELEAEAAGRELQTELVDKKHEEYKEPEKPRYNAFGGSGHSLTSDSPSTAAPAPAKANTTFNFDPSAPTVSIQVRFHDGTKATAKLNTSHTIMDLRAWIEANKPSGPYDLLQAFPPKPLTDLNQTVVAAGLAGAAVTQRLR